MASGIAQPGSPFVPVIHFSLVYPVTEKTTACGGVGPATKAWGYVTCPACLAKQPSKKCSR
jgi:hypothetical protein